MGKPSKAVMEFMARYSVDSDEIWEVHGSTWVVKHKALERVAAEVGIVWDRPELKVCDMAAGLVAVLISGKLGDHVEYSFGEASPKNNKNAYPIAMAEKRAKDRVILKLLASHGDLYSEEEADDFKRPNPHVTRPTDILPPAEYDQHGEIIENIPHAPPAQKLRVADQRPLFAAIQKEAHAFSDSAKFLAWMKDENTIARVADFKADWQEMFRGVCKEHLAELRKQEAGDDMRMAG
ncbi:hypothetical protein JQ633_00935 [Bradyrhizobium tropiciagri]|uniref:hypothetical protein n=1 Tax=Bradyrhizobium tropiciagri TaxID=312253 RepID=UPI001BAC1500|nr:hypothetical protein [Bradyrhizobium tropiciagri]MBR0868905.1 hypothetical protein [Bradyrhizobium tropiciagri]